MKEWNNSKSIAKILIAILALTSTAIAEDTSEKDNALVADVCILTVATDNYEDQMLNILADLAIARECVSPDGSEKVSAAVRKVLTQTFTHASNALINSQKNDYPNLDAVMAAVEKRITEERVERINKEVKVEIARMMKEAGEK